MTTTAVSAVVIAGGRSRRFGDRDKALADVEGTPMIRRVVDRLPPDVDELVVNCRREQRAAIEDVLSGGPLSPRFAVDAVPDRGPMYGLRTALRVATGQYAVALSCDVPYVEPALLTGLLEEARRRSANGVVPRVGDYRQPLCSVYRVDACRDACEIATGRSDPRLQTVLDCLDPLIVEEEWVREHADPRALTSVDTPADLDAAEADA